MGDRTNPDLDNFMNDVEAVAKKKKRKKAVRTPKDVIKRFAFKVLALLSGLDEAQRARVLAEATKLNKA